MNWNWEHIVYAVIGTLCSLWYVWVFVVLKKSKTKKNVQENDSYLQKSHIFVKNTSLMDKDMDQLLNRVDENETSSELLDIFNASDKDVQNESLIPEHEKFKIIKNSGSPPEPGAGDPD
ncbi:hypothetical protein [Pseudozobellia sp. WGM2]|uniref:hypothetical protein n=1 Tax=Pseudozobellia sp. WGM2 TaxID=2787625 RepID=UPI001ADF5B59|nr:hypothetical protein [Pseudozobellia sp. WGM2]